MARGRKPGKAGKTKQASAAEQQQQEVSQSESDQDQQASGSSSESGSQPQSPDQRVTVSVSTNPVSNNNIIVQAEESDNMASGGIDPFDGETNKDISTWIARFSWILESKNFTTEKQKIVFFATHLTGAALSWFLALGLDPTNIPTTATFNQIKTDFVKRFSVGDNLKWHAISLMYSIKQGDRSVAQYIAELRQLANRAGASQEQAVLACIAGMNAHIKFAIINQNLKSLDDIMQFCSVYDVSNPFENLEITSNVERLTNRVARLELGEGNNYAGVQAVQHQHSKSANNWTRRHKNSYAQPGAGQKNTQTEEVGLGKPCNRCGRTHPAKQCPAYGKKCGHCSRFNHFKKCCFKLKKE